MVQDSSDHDGGLVTTVPEIELFYCKVNDGKFKLVVLFSHMVGYHITTWYHNPEDHKVNHHHGNKSI
jgi:hypothetical protein